MRQVTETEFHEFMRDFADGGVHAVETQRFEALVGESGSTAAFSNPDAGLLGEIHHGAGIRTPNGCADVFLLAQ